MTSLSLVELQLCENDAPEMKSLSTTLSSNTAPNLESSKASRCKNRESWQESLARL